MSRDESTSDSQQPHERIGTDTQQFQVLRHCPREWSTTGDVAATTPNVDSSRAGGQLPPLEEKGMVERRGPETNPEWRVSVLGMGVRDWLSQGDNQQ